MNAAWINWFKRPIQGYQRPVGDSSPVSNHEVALELKRVAIKRVTYLQSVVEMSRPSYSAAYCFMKRGLDLGIGVFGLLCASPLFLLIALAIKLDSRGPVFYRQARLGKDGRMFWILKFRTMIQDAEKWTGPVWTSQGDPRITKVGALLRVTKLDELPQFLNLIVGHMSLVGPRPERPEFTDQFIKIIPAFQKRLLVKPGITGIAQLRNGADDSAGSVYRKLRYDITYIKKASFMADVRLILETGVAFLCKRL